LSGLRVAHKDTDGLHSVFLILQISCHIDRLLKKYRKIFPRPPQKQCPVEMATHFSTAPPMWMPCPSQIACQKKGFLKKLADFFEIKAAMRPSPLAPLPQTGEGSGSPGEMGHPPRGRMAHWDAYRGAALAVLRRAKMVLCPCGCFALIEPLVDIGNEVVEA
jgi:hypothetical protein